MTKYKILLLEDEEKTADMVKQALEFDSTMEVEHFTQAQNAIAHVTIGKYDLLILDIRLQGEDGMNGDDALEHIRKIDPYVEVLVYSNHDDPEELKHFLNLRVSGYAKKGANSDVWALVGQVKSILEPMPTPERENFINSLPTNPVEIQ